MRSVVGVVGNRVAVGMNRSTGHSVRSVRSGCSGRSDSHGLCDGCGSRVLLVVVVVWLLWSQG